MPLDGHSYLVGQGWSGRGTGLRQGAIVRPITVSQKKTLSGIGKDRDEAFPFWDHVFSAAAKAITIRVTSSDEDDSDSDTPAAPTLRRTTTGIICNKRPIEGLIATPSTSGSTTPDPTTPRLTLIATAKRDAAKRGLYSKFFRGPILGPDPALQKLCTTPAGSSKPAPTKEVGKVKLKRTAEEKELKRRRRAERAEKRERKRLRLEAKQDKADRKRRQAEAKAVAIPEAEVTTNGMEGVDGQGDATPAENEKLMKREKKRRRKEEQASEALPRKKRRKEYA